MMRALVSFSPDFSIDATKPWLAEIPGPQGWYSDEFETWEQAMAYADREMGRLPQGSSKGGA